MGLLLYRWDDDNENKAPRLARVVVDKTAVKRSTIRRRPSYTSSQPRVRPTRRRAIRRPFVTLELESELHSTQCATLPYSSAPDLSTLSNASTASTTSNTSNTSRTSVATTTSTPSTAPNAPNDHVSLAPFLASLMRSSVVLQLVMDRAWNIRTACQDLLDMFSGNASLEDDICIALTECDMIYELHARVTRQMRLLDQNLICSTNSTHIRENLRITLHQLTFQLERSTDTPTELMHTILSGVIGTRIIEDEEITSFIHRLRHSLPIIRFRESIVTGELEMEDLPPLRRVHARNGIPTAIVRPLSNEPQSRISSPPPASRTSVNSSSGLGDRSRSVSIEHDDTDAWDTMLATMEPDVNLPSQDSSFTSAAVSASFSSHTSAQEEVSASSESEPTPRATRRYHPHVEINVSTSLPWQPLLLSPPPEMDNIPPEEVSLSLIASNEPLSPPESNTPPPQESRFRTYDPLSHPELSHMRTILVGLSQSDAIPDDWWVSAGLTPYVLQEERLRPRRRSGTQ